MIVRSESYLPARNLAVHEAAHYAVGCLFNLPMGLPEVFRDGSGGRVPFDRPAIEEASAIDLGEIPDDINRRAATRICAMFLSGYAAEAIAADADTSVIIGGRTQDFRLAIEILDHAEQPHIVLEDAWRLAIAVLRKIWPAVMDLAGDVPVTDGTHRPPKFH